MLLSMTGYGEAHFQSDKLSLSVELRSLNNRHLKVSVRAPEPYNLLEPEFEKVLRKTVRRGTIQVNVRCERQFAPTDFRINASALRSYLAQLDSACAGLAVEKSVLLGQILALPGVVPEPGETIHAAEEEWPTVERVLEAAIKRLQIMRREEGAAMAQEFLLHHNDIATHLRKIKDRVPSVVIAYRDRLHERVRALLAELDVEIDRSDLIKEVAVFAERSDVAEEVVRLASHLEQFLEFLNESESPGRKLEFLTQEMFREANTIGSKAADVEISRQVVEIKATLEKVRELVQNVE